jgi:hypothetical protein
MTWVPHREKKDMNTCLIIVTLTHGFLTKSNELRNWEQLHPLSNIYGAYNIVWSSPNLCSEWFCARTLFISCDEPEWQLGITKQYGLPQTCHTVRLTPNLSSSKSTKASAPVISTPAQSGTAPPDNREMAMAEPTTSWMSAGPVHEIWLDDDVSAAF